MEAGIKSALPQEEYSKLYNILIDLRDLCIKLCTSSYYSDSYTEQKLVIQLLTTALSQSHSIALCGKLAHSTTSACNKTGTQNVQSLEILT
jgi:hypothetical protein